ncbi:beta-L-arabinofuranosidase domain-containing protein [Streptomyces europaeiscabiei]|uniref:beta-L-arabinofuranosidase domain-containing protein n=1 Tax=Streptomyces europaeiscabiei TaxID=146819 RepID=UPI002E2BB843|nr:beta-L-arabinofuranosidase domain-containing protein [Streptomyces europaeiscabiei]
MQSLPRNAVRLLPGPFLDAQTTALDYLLSLDTDRLLAPLRREAGLPPVAESYGNWENSGLDGHTVGHALSGAALMSAVTDAPRPRAMVERLVQGIVECQDALGTGYVGGIPDGVRLWRRVAAGQVEPDSFELGGAWVPWYNLHKLFAGLLDAHRHAGSDLALTAVRRLADWWDQVAAGMDENTHEAMLRTEFGGMCEVLADLADITGTDRYAALARRFLDRSLLGPLREHRDVLDGMHANTQIAKVVGYQRLGEVGGDPGLRDAARFFWQTMTRHRTFSFGGNSVREHLHPRDDFSSALQSPEGPETCNTYNMLKLSRALFLEEPDTEALDHYERATVNHILSSLYPKGGLVYFTPVRPGHYRVVSTPHNCFWCCVGTGLENHAKYGELVYTTEDDDLFVNLFIASRLTLPEQNLVLEQTQTAPYDDEVRLVVRGAPASPVALHIRVPSWHEGTPQVRINGAPPEEGPAQLTTRRGTGEQPLTYVRLERPWRAGDTVTMRLHPRISAELLPDGSPWVSFRFGPTVLAAEGDRDDLVGHFADDSRMGHVADGPLRPLEHLPVVLARSTADPAAGLRRLAPDRLAFALDHVDARPGESVTLVPFAGIHDSRYTLYFPLAEPERLHERRAELHAADEAALALHDRTVDTVAAGEQQPESDHRFQGQDTWSGHTDGRRWRAATGWWSYRLTDPDHTATALHVTHLADEDSGPTRILVNGHPLGILAPSPDPQSEEISHTLPLHPDRPTAPLEIRFEPVGPAATIRLREVRLVSLS